MEKITIDEDDEDSAMETASIKTADEDELLHREPSLAEIFKYIKKIDAQTAENNTYKETTSNRLLVVGKKADQNDNRIQQLEARIADLKSTVGTSSTTECNWSDQRSLRNNISVIGVPAANGENITKIIVELCTYFGVPITAAEVLSAYRVKSAKSDMLICIIRR